MNPFEQLQILRARLLAGQFTQALANTRNNGLLEDQISLYLNFLQQDQGDLSVPLLQAMPVRKGDPFHPGPYVTNFQDGIADIQLIFQWLQSLGQSNLALYNNLMSQYLGIKDQVNRLLSGTNDLELFLLDTAGGVMSVGDNFNNTSKVDITTSRTVPIARVDTITGLVTLPLATKPAVMAIQGVQINSASNGVNGNNQQSGVTNPHNDPKMLIDGDPSTWFEYEAVANGPRNDPLILDLTITLDKIGVINQCNLQFNNFGAAAWPELDDFLVSQDGKTFLSLKDELSQEPNGVNPSVSQTISNTGAVSYNFLPRQTRYLRLILKQSGYYLIDTVNGQQNRYAIGLSEINLQTLAFQTSGEFISLPYQFSTAISKVMLVADNICLPAGVCQMLHYVSPDLGNSWIPIQPNSGVSTQIPKVVNFNSQDPGAIQTPKPVTSLCYRTVLTRDESQLTNQSALVQYINHENELVRVPLSYPYKISLNYQPINDSVSLHFPCIGSRGLDRNIPLGTSDGSADQTFSIPITVPNQAEQVWINKQLWQRVADFSTSTSTSRVYAINYITNTIQFGNGVNGMIPPAAFQISLGLPREPLFFKVGDTISANLLYATAGEFQLYQIGSLQDSDNERLARGATVYRLQNQFIATSLVFVGDATGVFQHEKPFLNGINELTSPGDYSVDYASGTLYSRSISPVNQNITVSYQFRPRTAVANDYWQLSNDRTLILSPTVFQSQDSHNEDLSSQAGLYTAQLANTGVVVNSLAFSALANLTQELPFYDGVSEFNGLVFQKNESVPVGPNLFTLQHVPVQGYQVSFSDTEVFADPVDDANLVTVPGNYFIDFSTGKVSTYLPANGGVVSYYYHTDINNLEQSYSVDYRNGVLYLYAPLAIGVTTSYKYSAYEASYYIAEAIPASAYELHSTTQEVVFTDPAYINNLRKRFTTDDLLEADYQYVDQVSLNQAGVAQMFTPMLFDYHLRVIPAGNQL